jgi:hypothetical protein
VTVDVRLFAREANASMSQAGSSDRAEIGQADPTITAKVAKASKRIGKTLPDRPN